MKSDDKQWELYKKHEHWASNCRIIIIRGCEINLRSILKLMIKRKKKPSFSDEHDLNEERTKCVFFLVSIVIFRCDFWIKQRELFLDVQKVIIKWAKKFRSLEFS